MEKPVLGSDMIRHLLSIQKEEITSHHTYARLASAIKDPGNQKTIRRISSEELKHYHLIKKYTGQEVDPDWRKINLFFWISRILGFTFGMKLLEKGEGKAQQVYGDLAKQVPELNSILAEEETHEDELLGMLDEESLKYAGSVVLGLNDALVELTGALAGFTFAFQNTHLVALAGLITGISAAFSMASSEYLSVKSEGGDQNPGKSALYTGIAYIFTVIFLILPYLLISNYLVALITTISIAILIIAIFNYYISVAKDLPFRKRFFEMAGISLGVAAISFFVGYFVRIAFGIDI